MTHKKTNGNGKKSYGASTDDIMDFLEHHMVIREDFEERVGGLEKHMGGLEERVGGLEKHMGGLEERVGGLENELKKTNDIVLGLSNLIRRHLEISDDRYFEVRKKHELYEYWIKKMAEKLKMKLEIPKDLARALS
ncbi:hypothetical protein HY839_04770 [Candidatus Azambacteria bacterium]|nr:hypothetical protein [Candidatus Azambacteria bacterium]